MHALAVTAAALLAVVILWDSFQTMVLSRRVAPRFRPTRAFYRALWAPIRAVVRTLPPGRRRENILTVFGPASLLLLIGLWAFGLILAFALLHWGLGSEMRDAEQFSGFGEDLYVSATTF